MIKIIYIAVYLVLQMSIVWWIARRLKNPGVIDVAWSIGLMVAGIVYLLSPTMMMRQWIVMCLLLIWGIRLGGYLYWARVRKGLVEKRYMMLSQSWSLSKSVGYFFHFQLQGLLIWLLAFVFIAISNNHLLPWNGIDNFGLILSLIGIIGESIADWQLQDFKKHHQGGVCNQGLWRYSRHPNYFFEWLVWCGFAVFGIQALHGWLGLLSPVLLYLLMTQVTGPVTERGSIESRGDAYRYYQQQTSPFIIWFHTKRK